MVREPERARQNGAHVSCGEGLLLTPACLREVCAYRRRADHVNVGPEGIRRAPAPLLLNRGYGPPRGDGIGSEPRARAVRSPADVQAQPPHRLRYQPCIRMVFARHDKVVGLQRAHESAPRFEDVLMCIATEDGELLSLDFRAARFSPESDEAEGSGAVDRYFERDVSRSELQELGRSKAEPLLEHYAHTFSRTSYFAHPQGDQ